MFHNIINGLDLVSLNASVTVATDSHARLGVF